MTLGNMHANGVRTLAVLMLVFGVAAPVAAGPLEDAVAAEQRGDYATALRLLRLLADRGIAAAQFNLGAMYDNGHGVPQDYAEALKWYRLAAEQGNAAAQYNLGIMYAKGQGVPQNYTEAEKWYRLAAEQGNAAAQNNLGVMYGNGQGMPHDFVRARLWFNLSAAQGNKNAEKNRDIIAGQMTPAQIAEAQKLAREWKSKKER